MSKFKHSLIANMTDVQKQLRIRIRSQYSQSTVYDLQKESVAQNMLGNWFESNCLLELILDIRNKFKFHDFGSRGNVDTLLTAEIYFSA